MKKLLYVGALSALLLAACGDTEQTNEEPAKTNAAETEKTEPTAKADDNAGLMTEEKFAQISDGMTYEEVVAIVGAEGKVLSETGTVGDPFYTVVYEFETDGILSVSTLMFQGGKLLNKSQVGLGTASDVEVSLESFNQLKNGMTYEEVKEVLGGEGDVLSESAGIATYQYQGNTAFSSVTLMFQENKLINKTQLGLE